MVWSQKFIDVKKEVGEFYKLLNDDTRTPEQIENAFKGVGIIIFHAIDNLDDDATIREQAEQAQIGTLLRMVTQSKLEYDIEQARRVV